MSPDCLVCGGEKDMHTLWMGKPCPHANRPPMAPSLQDLTKEAIRGSKREKEIEELELMWLLSIRKRTA